MAHEHRTYPLGEEVSELRKHRGEPNAEKELHSYKKMRDFSKASGTWGKKNAKSKALEKKKEIKHHGKYSSGLSETAKKAMRESKLEVD